MKHELIFWDIIENMLTSNTGSTTVLLEAITGCNLNVKVLKQETLVKNQNLQWSGNTICRESVLFTAEREVSYNIVYINWDELNSNIRDALKKGTEPIGKIIINTDHRRELLYSGIVTREMQSEFNINESCTDNVLKKYAIWTGNICLFLIYEMYYIENLKYCVNKREERGA